MRYEHTQIGYFMISILVLVTLLFGFVLVQTGFYMPIFLFMCLILLILASFSSLSVMINEHYLQIKFSYGIFKKRFSLSEIKSARTVKHHWYYGWGIRYWIKPKMWIYNVSGFDAVEITMKDGRLYRIGTDQPKELERAIQLSI
jgi:hypothetical protein